MWTRSAFSTWSARPLRFLGLAQPGCATSRAATIRRLETLNQEERHTVSKKAGGRIVHRPDGPGEGQRRPSCRNWRAFENPHGMRAMLVFMATPARQTLALIACVSLMLNWRDPWRNPKGGGAERVSRAYLAELVRRGHEACWFANDFPGARREETIEGIRVTRGGGRGASIWEALKWYRRQKPPDLRDCISTTASRGYAPWWCKTNCVAYIHEVLGPDLEILLRPAPSARSANGRNAAHSGSTARYPSGRLPNPPAHAFWLRACAA